MIRFYKLFDILNRREMKKSDLFSILSSETVSRITKGGDVTTQTINRICAWLDVQPGDIMEYIPEENENGDKL